MEIKHQQFKLYKYYLLNLIIFIIYLNYTIIYYFQN